MWFRYKLLYARYACTGYRKETREDIGVRVFALEFLERNHSRNARNKFVFDPRINAYELTTVCLKEPSVDPRSGLTLGT